MNRHSWTMAKPELEEGLELAPHEMPIHAELSLANTPTVHNKHSQWQQKGVKLTCLTCPDEHGLFVSPNMIFTGDVNEEGAPILKRRW